MFFGVNLRFEHIYKPARNIYLYPPPTNVKFLEITLPTQRLATWFSRGVEWDVAVCPIHEQLYNTKLYNIFGDEIFLGLYLNKTKRSGGMFRDYCQQFRIESNQTIVTNKPINLDLHMRL